MRTVGALRAGGLLALAVLHGCASTSHEGPQAGPPALVVPVEPLSEPLQPSPNPDADKDERDARPSTGDVEPPPTGDVELTTTGDVERYPDMIRVGGTYVLGKTYDVHQAADPTSNKLSSLAPGTLVNFLYRRGPWIMVDWPAGPGQLAPGWIRDQYGSPNIKRVDADE